MMPYLHPHTCAPRVPRGVTFVHAARPPRAAVYLFRSAPGLSLRRAAKSPGSRSPVLRISAASNEKRKTPFEDGFWKNLKNKPKSTVFEGAGADLRCELQIDFKDGILGAQKPLTLERKVFCKKCKGKGHIPSTAIPCSTCDAKGRRSETCTLTVTVPPGVQEGAQLRLKGQGDDGSNGNPGNLIVRLSVPSFTSTLRREGANLYSDVGVTQEDLTNGTTVNIELIDGAQGKIKVPAGSKVGAYLRIKGKGAPEKVNSEDCGDHYFRLVLKS